MNEIVSRLLENLTRVEGVRAAVVVDDEAGVPVASQVTPGVPEPALAALSGALFRRTAGASRSTGFGDLRLLQLETEGGYLLVAGAGPLLVSVLTESDARIGMVRVQVARAAEELSR